VKTKAISAGALIALSADRLIMANNTTIGDCAPISMGSEGPVMLGEKFQSPLRAKFRALAKKNGYNEKLSEAMVSTDFEITRVEIDGKNRYLEASELASLSPQEKAKIKNRKVVVKKGQLLTMDSTEAKELGFSKATVSGIEDGLKTLGIPQFSVTPLNKTWTETFLGWIITISPILIMIGMAAVYMEMKVPGFGTPGIVGIICLGLAFGSQFAIGMANYAELLIILLGVLLLGLEVFVIPGFGVAGIAGFIMIGIGFVLSLQDFVIPKPSMPWQKQLLIHNVFMVFGSYILAVITGLLVIRYVFPRLSIGQTGPYLTADLKYAHADSHETVKIKAGDEGIAMSFLRPAGKMKKGEDYFDVISEGEFIEKDTPVIVVRISGNRIIVTRKEQT
jgi:membrane-bound serine protease (ClpP class)